MAALNHNAESFAQEVERALGIARSLARRLIDDPSGEPVLVLAMALRMPADALQRILLCLNPAISHSVLRVYELSKLYEEIEPQSAARLLGIWQATHKPAQRLPRSSRCITTTARIGPRRRRGRQFAGKSTSRGGAKASFP